MKKDLKGKIKFIDLFAGIGGIRTAFESNGAECVFSSEWDKDCQKTYFANFGEIPAGDITKIDPNEIPDHDILTGGFPCQPFSSIGKRQGFKHPTQGTLFFDVVRILKEKKPRAFLLENVPGLKTHDNGNTFKVIKETLRNELGYSLFTKVMNASNHGVPQQRKRIYMVGFSKDLTKGRPIKFHFPKKEKNKIGIGKFIEKNPIDRKYSITKHLQDVYMFKVDDGRPQLVDQKSDFPVKTLVATYHKIQRLTGTFVKDGETGMRLLSENECKSIMGFDVYEKLYNKKFVLPVSRTQMYHQLGNSVAIPVVQKIAKNIIKCLNELTDGKSTRNKRDSKKNSR